jgi:hypothetical protein
MVAFEFLTVKLGSSPLYIRELQRLRAAARTNAEDNKVYIIMARLTFFVEVEIAALTFQG